jgi:hypothetical protein
VDLRRFDQYLVSEPDHPVCIDGNVGRAQIGDGNLGEGLGGDVVAPDAAVVEVSDTDVVTVRGQRIAAHGDRLHDERLFRARGAAEDEESLRDAINGRWAAPTDVARLVAEADRALTF